MIRIHGSCVPMYQRCAINRPNETTRKCEILRAGSCNWGVLEITKITASVLVLCSVLTFATSIARRNRNSVQLARYRRSNSIIIRLYSAVHRHLKNSLRPTVAGLGWDRRKVMRRGLEHVKYQTCIVLNTNVVGKEGRGGVSTPVVVDGLWTTGVAPTRVEEVTFRSGLGNWKDRERTSNYLSSTLGAKCISYLINLWVCRRKYTRTI
jgi:hypothetical protein